MATNLKCPNCGAAAVAKEGGACVCPACGGTFTFTEGEARLAGVGEYDQLKGKVDELAAGQRELRELLGKPEPPPADPDEPPEIPDDPDPDDDEDEEDW